MDSRNYSCQYSGRLRAGTTLDDLYEKFNLHRPSDFLGHSMSVSDVVVLNQYGSPQAFYVDSFGFTPVPEFFEHNPLAKVEELLEDDYGMIDGIINNGEKSKEQPPSKASLLDKLHEKKQEAEKTNLDRPKPETEPFKGSRPELRNCPGVGCLPLAGILRRGLFIKYEKDP